jgi:YgiT-type zinc finger domain-containing protein
MSTNLLFIDMFSEYGYDLDMKLFEKCPVCGGEPMEKEVEKVLRSGSNTAIVRVEAQVCQHCGERLYKPETIIRFEEIRQKLSKEDVGDFEPVN